MKIRLNAEERLEKIKRDALVDSKRIFENTGNPDALNYKNTPILITAIVNNDIEFVKILLDAGANPNIKNAPICTAVWYAKNKPEILDLLQKSPKFIKSEERIEETKSIIQEILRKEINTKFKSIAHKIEII